MGGQNDLEFMAELDEQYREASKLQERRFYSIFYSRIAPAPIMILGINPGGDPSTWTMPAGADEFCTNWQHDYVDERYPIQGAMLPLLTSTLGIIPDIVRRIPKTNMVFRRSSQEGRFSEQQNGMTMDAALLETAPFLKRIIQRVSPKAIIFEGFGALSRFMSVFGAAGIGSSMVPTVTTPNGRSRARIYAVHEVQTKMLPQSVTAIVLAHPSKYAARAEFSVARDDMASRLAGIGAELLSMGPPPQVPLKGPSSS